MKAPEINVVTDDGRTLPLAEFYQTQELALVFLRHLGCIFCRQQVAQLRVHSSLNIAFVCMADVEKAAEFKQKMRTPHTFIADPNREVYQAFGLGKGESKQVFNPKVFAKGMGAILAGHFVGQPVGDVWQMPGIFVINPQGEIIWEYKSVDIADNPNADQLIRQLT